MAESVKLAGHLAMIVATVVACGAATRRPSTSDASHLEVEHIDRPAHREPLIAAELVPVLPMPSALAVEDGIPFRCMVEHGGALLGIADTETHSAMLWVVHLPPGCYDGRILFAVPRVTPMR